MQTHAKTCIYMQQGRHRRRQTQGGGGERRTHLFIYSVLIYLFTIFYTDLWPLVPKMLSLVMDDPSVIYPGTDKLPVDANLVIAVGNSGK